MFQMLHVKYDNSVRKSNYTEHFNVLLDGVE